MLKKMSNRQKSKEFLAILLIYLFVFQPFLASISSASYGGLSPRLKVSDTEIKSKDEILSFNKDITSINGQEATIPESLKKDIKNAYGKMPIQFIENRGQVDERVRYYVKRGGTTIWFTDNEIIFDVVKVKDTEKKASATNSDNPIKAKSLRLGKVSIQKDREFERHVVKMSLKNANLRPKFIDREKKQES